MLTASAAKNSPLSTRFKIQAARLCRRIVTARNSANAPGVKPAVSRYGVK